MRTRSLCRSNSRGLKTRLYVAVTRAETQVVVVGQQSAVDMAVRKVRDVRRRTLLGLWLARERGAA